MSKAKEVNAASVRTLERLKGELPSTKPLISSPTSMKPQTPVEPK